MEAVAHFVQQNESFTLKTIKLRLKSAFLNKITVVEISNGSSYIVRHHPNTINKMLFLRNSQQQKKSVKNGIFFRNRNTLLSERLKKKKEKHQIYILFPDFSFFFSVYKKKIVI